MRYDRRGEAAWHNGGESVAYALWSVVLERMLTVWELKLVDCLLSWLRQSRKI
ncbi:hypothetical protein [Synechocystis sp. PCC 7509]|uniref:hypothetical protein n=1 Tax=Synechocystis sp. PCC 7509 TaxID=927677 RepID=UPI0002ABD663|nr:hypothetical protein [Synechocystis sp. PCC 7509]